jgi:uncharacterized membrane protein YqgA involved in biofilm formation
MKGFGTILNIITVLAGGSLGLLIGSRFTKALHDAVMSIIGLVTLSIGIQMVLGSKNILIVLTSLLIGIIVGELINIEGKLESVGRFLENRFSNGDKGQFTKAFVTSSLLFCVGPMTILGSIQDGLSGDAKLLITKSVLDGFTSIAFSAAMGVGVLFTSITILIVQGGLTLFASLLSGILTQDIITELTATGGIMILSLGFGMLNMKKFKTANMLPALVIVPVIMNIIQMF